MEWLNYHHLLYFWTAAREGSVTRAAERLRLQQSTVSTQIRALEESLGHRLFEKKGRGIVLTESGRLVCRYAEEIFGTGRELLDVLKRGAPGRAPRLSVGVADVVPKLIAWRLLEPALALPERPRIVCHEDHHEKLLAQLALHELDLVLTDTPVGSGTPVRAFNHLLGECGSAVFGAPALASRHGRGFPRSLDGAPFLLPAEPTALRRSIMQWFEDSGIRPEVVGEFQDSALLKVFGQTGMGLFFAPQVIEKEVCAQYGVRRVGRVEEVRERFYAISAERRLKHPAVVAVSEAARARLFG